MPELTFVVPYASYHADVVQRAVDSVLAQTIPCNVVTIEDSEAHGTGWARNQGLRKVNSPMVAFLDADDTIEPTFAEHCLQVWSAVQGMRYVYTNWYGAGGREIVAVSPCDMWKPMMLPTLGVNDHPEDYDRQGDMFVKRTFHPVTTMIPAEYVRRIGGFDENMPALEDADFYKRLIISGVCGIHLNDPVFTYRSGGQRSVNARINIDGSSPEQSMMRYMNSRYGGYSMGCCGDDKVNPLAPEGDQRQGDILAQAQWRGNDRKRSLVDPERLYPRTSFPKLCYVNAEDVAAAPHLWKKANAAAQSSSPALQPGYQPRAANWKSAADAAFGSVQPAAPAVNIPMDYQVQTVQNTRNLTDKLKLAQRKTE